MITIKYIIAGIYKLCKEQPRLAVIQDMLLEPIICIGAIR